MSKYGLKEDLERARRQYERLVCEDFLYNGSLELYTVINKFHGELAKVLDSIQDLETRCTYKGRILSAATKKLNEFTNA